MAEEVVDKWLVLQAETGDKDSGLWAASTFFADYSEALAYVEKVVRTEWCTTIPSTGDGAGAVLLGDSRGAVHPKGFISHAEAYYSEDGTEAFVREGYHDECGKMIQVVKAAEEGVRVCSNS